MESLVVSLEVAKQLKAAGWEHETALYYAGRYADTEDYDLCISAISEPSQFDLAAPTASEIAANLPTGLKIIHYSDVGWIADRGFIFISEPTDTMIDALASLWLKLREGE